MNLKLMMSIMFENSVRHQTGQRTVISEDELSDKEKYELIKKWNGINIISKNKD